MAPAWVARMSEFAAKIAEAIALGRVNAEALMQDHVRVWRTPPGPGVEDDWGVVTPPEPVLVYEGRAKAQNDRTYPSSPDVGGVARVTAMVSHVHFPHGTSVVRGDDVVEWVSSVNPRLVGRRVRLSVDQDKTWNTSTRMNVAEVVV